jgi:predicted glycoside hydrolase/deacetylase ChbG (UPF0249 family)
MAEAEREFALCADDYALTEGVSRAMLDLVDARRLTAVSAMASMPGWPELAGELRVRRGVVAIGLHLDLTLRPFAGERRPFGLGEIVVKSLAGQIEGSVLAIEFHRQFDAFETALGAAPDHVDGHHHIHGLPRVREALAAVLMDRYRLLSEDMRPLVRAPADAAHRIWRRRGARAKASTVAALCMGFAARMKATGFATNDGFAGFSRHAGGKGLHREFASFLAARGPRHLVMCHPGFPSADLARLDPLAEGRRAEYALLMERGELAREMLRIDRSRDQPGGAFASWRAR